MVSLEIGAVDFRAQTDGVQSQCYYRTPAESAVRTRPHEHADTVSDNSRSFFNRIGPLQSLEPQRPATH